MGDVVIADVTWWLGLNAACVLDVSGSGREIGGSLRRLDGVPS